MITTTTATVGLRLQDVTVAGGPRGLRLSVAALQFGPGITVVVGENGAGKSTLLDVCAGLIPPGQGRVLLGSGDADDVVVAQVSAVVRARRIASLGQRPRAAPWLSAGDRIAQGLIPRRGTDAVVDDVTRARVAAVATELGIAALLPRPLVALSGGEQQRVHLARALIDDDADVLILDEPFAGLDDNATDLLIASLRKRRSRIVVVSVHDLGIAAILGQRLIGIRQGEVVVDGALPDTMSDAERVFAVPLRVVVDGDWVGVMRRRNRRHAPP